MARQQDYAEYGFGIILTGEEIDQFVKANTSEDLELDPYDFSSENEDVRYYDDEMEGKFISYINGESDEGESMLAIWAKHQPDAFKAAYVDKYGLIREMKERYVFPKDFNWDAHIGYFSCCIYC